MSNRMFNRIVLAIDRVKGMDRPIRIALDMMQRYDAELFPIHIVDIPEHPSLPEYYERESGKVGRNDIMDEIEERGGKIVQDLCEKMDRVAEKEGIDYDCLCRLGVGEPGDTIVNFTSDVEGDIIVMGVHGRKGLDRVLHGSVSSRVIRESPVPVLSCHV